MSLSTSGLSTILASMQADAARQSFSAAMLKQHASSEASVVALVEQALDAAKAGPPPPGQGRLVDLRA